MCPPEPTVRDECNAHGLLLAVTTTVIDCRVEQLDCGARAIDARPAVVKGQLMWHHGAININHLFSDSLAETTKWLAMNPDELVIFKICKESITSVDLVFLFLLCRVLYAFLSESVHEYTLKPPFSTHML